MAAVCDVGGPVCFDAMFLEIVTNLHGQQGNDAFSEQCNAHLGNLRRGGTCTSLYRHVQPLPGIVWGCLPDLVCIIMHISIRVTG